jgi:hypothetical protein
MAEKRRKGAKTKRMAKPRDPAWRLRRALGHKAEESPKAYRRTAERRAARGLDPETADD